MRSLSPPNGVSRHMPPVPPTYWYDADGEFYPYPAMIYGFAEGVAKPSATTSNGGNPPGPAS